MPTVEELALHGGVQLPKRTLSERAQALAIKNAYGPVFGGVAVEDLSRGAGVSVSLVFGLAWFVTFACLLWSMTVTTMGQKYLSLTSSDADSQCDEVPVAIKGVFEASYDGLWETSPAFLRNTSILEFTLTAKKMTNAEFSAGILRMRDHFMAMGRDSAQRNVANALMQWTSFVIFDSATGMSVTSSADSGITFQGQAFQAAMTSAAGVCDARIATGASLSSRFDVPTASIVMRFKLVTINTTSIDASSAAGIPAPAAPGSAANVSSGGTLTSGTSERKQARAVLQFAQPCPRQGLWVTPDILQISPTIAQFRNGYMEFGFDVRSAILAVALNLGVTSPDKFVRVNDHFSRSIGLVALYDPWYKTPPMMPVYCLDKNKMMTLYGLQLDDQAMRGPQICLLASSFGTRTLFYFYPMLFQFFNDNSNRFFDKFQGMSECLCPDNAMESSCNIEKYFFSFFYSTDFSLRRTIEFALRNQQIITSSQQGDIALSRDLAKIVSYSTIIDGSRTFADRPIVSFFDSASQTWQDRSGFNNQTLNQLLAAEWQRVWPAGSAFVFQLNRYPAQTDVVLAINKHKVTVSSLARNWSAEDPDKNYNFSIQYSQAAGREPVNKAARMLQLPRVMCTDSFSKTGDGFFSLAETPPIRLVENYFSCHKLAKGALLASVGNAAASSSLYVGIAWGVAGILYVLVLHLVKPKKQLVLTQDVREEMEKGLQELKEDALYAVVASLSKGERDSAAFDNFARLHRRPLRSGEAGEHDCQLVGRALTSVFDTRDDCHSAPSLDFRDHPHGLSRRLSSSSSSKRKSMSSQEFHIQQQHQQQQHQQQQQQQSHEQRGSLSTVSGLPAFTRHPLDATVPRARASLVRPASQIHQL